MKHLHYEEVQREEVSEAGTKGVRVRWLISAGDGAPNFYMRRFEVEAGGRTCHHEHAWEHEVYVLEGQGTVFAGGHEERFRAGDVIYIPPHEEHYFAADAANPVAFLCLIPKKEGMR